MTIWFVVEGANEAEVDTRSDLFRATYLAAGIRGEDCPDEDEQVGTMVKDATKVTAFTGSSRVDSPTAAQIGSAHASWLTVHETPEFFDTWDWPEPGP